VTLREAIKELNDAASEFRDDGYQAWPDTIEEIRHLLQCIDDTISQDKDLDLIAVEVIHFARTGDNNVS
jgi:hypothetical protein